MQNFACCSSLSHWLDSMFDRSGCQEVRMDGEIELLLLQSPVGMVFGGEALSVLLRGMLRACSRCRREAVLELAAGVD
jgi:hypothetical protein